MKELLDRFLGFVADATNASTIVLYREMEGGIFAPVAYFNVNPQRNLDLEPVSEEDENLVSEVLRRWSFYITSDEKLLAHGLPYHIEGCPKVFMAVPFKLGKEKALLCMDSFELSAFNDKQQKMAREAAEIIRGLERVGDLLMAVQIPEAKLKLLNRSILLFCTFPFEEAFVEWCSFLGVDYGLFLVEEQGELQPVAEYKRGELPQFDIEVPPRSPLFIALEQGSPYIFVDEMVEFFPGYSAYGLLIPSKVPGLKGVLLVTSSQKDFFADEVLDVMEAASYILSYMASLEVSSRRDSKAVVQIEPVDVENRLKILVSRARKEGRVLGVLLFLVKGMEKEYAKRGFWSVEAIMNEALKRAVELRPLPEFVCRLSDNALILGRVFDTQDEVVEYKKDFNTALSDVVDFKDCSTEVLIYPVDVDTTEGLLEEIGEKLVKSKKRGWI